MSRIVKKHTLRLWVCVGIITFAGLLVLIGGVVYRSLGNYRAYAAADQNYDVFESPNWKAMQPEEMWKSATDRTLKTINPDSSLYETDQKSTYHVLKKEESSSSLKLKMAAYFDETTKNDTRNKNAQFIYIADPVFQRNEDGSYKLDASRHKMPARSCQTYDPNNAYGSSNAFITVTLSYDLNDGSKKQAVYNIPESNVCPYNATTSSRPSNSNSVTDTKHNNFFARYPIPDFMSNPSAKMDPDTHLYKVGITIAYDDNIPAGFTAKGIDFRQQLVFRVKISDRNCASASCNRYIGMVSADNPVTEDIERNYSTLTRLLDAKDRFYGAQRFEFGLSCSIDRVQTKSVTVYDTDNNDAGYKLTAYHIEAYDKATGSWSKILASDYLNPKNADILSVDTIYKYDYETDGDALTPRVEKSQTMLAQTVVPSYGSGVDSTVSFRMQPETRYRLVVDPVWANNLISVGLPTDSIYGLSNCPAAAPTAACVNDSVPTGLAYGTKVRIRPAVRVANVVGPWPKASITLNFAITDPSGTRTAYTSLIYSGEGEGDSATLTATDGIELDVTKLGKYHFEWTLGGAVGVAMGLNCNVDSYAGEQPYFTVYGGDILAGISSSKWAAADDAGITSWNKDNTDSGGYAGAGTQLAAISSGSVSHFVSNYASLIGAPSDNPSSLVFANAGAVGSGQYGGAFEVLPTVPSYIDLAVSKAGMITPIASSDFDLSSIDHSGVYKYEGTGNLTVHGTVQVGKNITVIVTGGGSVYIGGDITYEPYSLATIPQLNIFTDGNILVGSSVKEMHGIYVAEGAASTFYTCSVDASTPVGYATFNLDPAQTAALVTRCKTPLSVYGSVVSKEIVLSRTSGNWVTGSAPAEEFKHSPESWLAKPFMGTETGDNIFDNYVSLPPIF